MHISEIELWFRVTFSINQILTTTSTQREIVSCFHKQRVFKTYTINLKKSRVYKFKL